MTVEAYYALTPNYDNSQDTEYPEGNKPNATVPEVPTGFRSQEETTTTIQLVWEFYTLNHTGFEIQQWIFGTSTSWDQVTTPGPAERQYKAEGLPEGTHIGHRIRALGAGEPSAWAPEVWVNTKTTVTPPPEAGEWGGMVPTKFVSAAASNGDGSFGNPWTWEQACDDAQAGDVVGWFAGVYVGKNPRPQLDSDASTIEELRGYPAMNVKNSGSSGSPIVMVAQWPAAYYTDRALYTDLRSGSDGKDPKTGGTWHHNTHGGRASDFGWPVFGAAWGGGDYVEWWGMFSDENDDNNKIIEDCGICTLRSGVGLVARNNRLLGSRTRIYKGNNWSGFRCENANGVHVADNHVTGFGQYPTTLGANCAGILTYYCEGYLYEHNEFYDCNHAIQLKAGFINGTHIIGTIQNNYSLDCFQFLRASCSGGADTTERSTMRHNLGVGCTLPIFIYEPNQPPTGAPVRDPFYRMDMYNNTFYSTKNSSVDAASWGQTWQRVSPLYNSWKNNIIKQPGRYVGSYSRNAAQMAEYGPMDFNCAHGHSNFAMTNESSNSRKTWTHAQWTAETGMEGNSIEQDPLFEDVAGGNFRLAGNSPCRGSGEAGETMGCYITGNEQIGNRVPAEDTEEWGGLTPNKFVSDGTALLAAMDTLVAGDILGVYPGTYVGVQPPSTIADPSKLRFTPAFLPKNDGNASNPIRIVAQWPAAHHTDAAKYTDIRSGSTTDGTGTNKGGWPAFGTLGCDYIEWIGMYSSGIHSNNKWAYDAAPCSIWSTTGSKVRLCRIQGSDSDYNDGSRNYSAIRLEEGIDVEIYDNHFSDFYSNKRTNSAGIIFYYSRGFNIHHNTVDRCTHGFHFKGGASAGATSLYGEVGYNHIMNCVHGFRHHGPGLGPNSERSALHHNLIESTTYFMEQTTSGGEDAMDGVDYVNNTFVKGGSDDPATCNWIALSSAKSNTMKHCIIDCTKSFVGTWSGGTGGTGDDKIAEHINSNYNCITADNYMHKPNVYSLTSWRSKYGQETGSFTSDPKFTDAANGDYTLASDSPCRGSGEGGATMGCYEVGNEIIGVRP